MHLRVRPLVYLLFSRAWACGTKSSESEQVPRTTENPDRNVLGMRMLLLNNLHPQPLLRGPHPQQNQAIPAGGASFQPNSGIEMWGGCGGAQERGLRGAERAVSQRSRYFSSSCSAGDKDLPSPFPGAWERRASTLQSRIGGPEVFPVLRRQARRTPFGGARMNLLGGLSWPVL